MENVGINVIYLRFYSLLIIFSEISLLSGTEILYFKFTKKSLNLDFGFSK